MQLLKLNELKISPSFVTCFERAMKDHVLCVLHSISPHCLLHCVPQGLLHDSALRAEAHHCQNTTTPHPQVPSLGRTVEHGVTRECSELRDTKICYHTIASFPQN